MIKFTRKVFRTSYFLKSAFRKHFFKILVITILGFISGLLGGVGIGAIIPLFALVNPIAEIKELDAISALIRRGFTMLGVEYSLLNLLLVMGILFLCKSIFLYVANYITSREAVDYESQTRKELFEITIKANWFHLLNQRIGYLTTILYDDIQGSSSILGNISALILTLTSLIMYAFIAFKISATITLLTLAIGIALFFVFKPLFYKIRLASRHTAEMTKIVAHHINQQLIGAKVVKTLAVETSVIDISNKYFDKLRHNRLVQFKYNGIFSTFLEPLVFVIIVPLFIISYRSPDFNIAVFAATIYLVQKIFSFMQITQSRLNGINQNIPNLHNLIAYQNSAKLHRESIGGKDPFVFEKEITFQNVHFKYDERISVLHDIDFTIKKSQKIGLIGPSGTGKTTIVDLFLRLLNPDRGTIRLDDKNITEIDRVDWHKHIGYVSQDMFLLNDTILNNIKFYDESYNLENIMEAAKQANIYEFIQKQPDKFNTNVGERGLQLSAGQRQRIALARVLLRKPEILILDEATSALDNESEVAIQESINNLSGKMTILMIAHRLSTVINADQIIAIDGGRIIETGNPKELLKDINSYFYKIYNL